MKTDTRLALLEESMKQNKSEHKEIKDGVLRIENKLDAIIAEKVDKAEFVFWRNWIVGGVLGSIFLATIALVADKYLK